MTGKKIELDGKTWTKYSVSVWDTIKTREENQLKHPAMFPLELCERLISIYTHKGDTVLDPFLGSGSTLVAAKCLARTGIGFELNKDYVKLASKRLKMFSWGSRVINNKSAQKDLLYVADHLDEFRSTEKIKIELPAEKDFLIYNENCMNITKNVKPETVDFVLTSPPYWDILNQKRTADYKEIRNYSDDKDDFGNIEDYKTFITTMGDVFEKCLLVLRPGGYCCVIVMDLRKKDKFYPLHSDIADELKKRGFQFEDIIIWNRLKEYNNLRSLGYPYVFRVNKIHEYILIFRKDK